jgi:hypothetical protein
LAHNARLLVFIGPNDILCKPVGSLMSINGLLVQKIPEQGRAPRVFAPRGSLRQNELAIGHAREGLRRQYDFAELWELRRDAFAKVSGHIAALISRPPEIGKVASSR